MWIREKPFWFWVKLCLAAALFAVLIEIALLAGALRHETEIRARVTAELPVLVDRHARLIRKEARQEIQETRKLLLREIADTRSDAMEAIRETSDKLDARLAETVAEFRPLLSDSQRLVRESQTLVASYSQLPDRLAYANRWLWDCENYSGCLQSQTLALVGSARHTMGQVAKAAPGIVESMDRLADSSGKAAENLSVSAANLAEITRPGPKWLRRIGLVGSVALPFAQISTPFVIWKLNSGQKPSLGSAVSAPTDPNR